MREGLGQDTPPNGSRFDHISDAAIDRSRGVAGDAAFQQYVQLAAPFWATVHERATSFGATRRDTDPEVLHALRVALRRLKALQWAYRPRIDATDFKRERRATGKLLHTAGRVRDWDIALSLADDWAPRLQKMRAALSIVRADAALFGATDVKQQLAGLGVDVGVAAGPMQAAAGVASGPIDLEFLAARLDAARHQMRKRVKQAERAGAAHYPALHEVRKAGKRVRDVHALIVEFTRTRLAQVDNAGTSSDHIEITTGDGPLTPEARADAVDRSGKKVGRKQTKKQLKKQDRWAGRLLTKRQRRRLRRVQSRFGALNDVVHSAALLRTTAKRSGRFARTVGVDRFLRTLDDVARRYRREALSAL